MSRLAFAAALALATGARASVTISSHATKNISCAAGVCAPTAKVAFLNTDRLAEMLANKDVRIVTGNGAVTITVADTLSWASTHRLTLDAALNVSFRAPVEVTGQGGLTIVTNDGGSGGDVLFFPGGKVDFWDTAGSLVVNGGACTLVSDIATLAGDIAANPSGLYALAKDYDASADGTYTNAPISTPFAGTFEGLGHTFSNFALDVGANPRANQGFFSDIAASGVVRDLALTAVNVSSNHAKERTLAALAGENDGSIVGVLVSGRIAGTIGPIAVGGIVGINKGTIARAVLDQAQVSSKLRAAGIAVENAGTITLSHTNATVAGGINASAGGLVTENEGLIDRSWSAGEVSVGSSLVRGARSDEYAGGVATYNDGTITDSYSIADVDGGNSTSNDETSSTSFAGGVVAQNNATVANVYSRGAIVALNAYGICVYVGGVAAVAYAGSIANAYAAGSVSTDCTSGGFIGVNYGGGLASDYWDTDTAGVGQGCNESCTGVTGLSDTQLKSGLPAGFDPAIWGEDAAINGGYPYLLANPPQ